MVTCLVLMTVERGSINEVADKLVGIDGVSEVFSVAGQYDLVALIRVANNEAVADVVTDGMRKIDGIKTSETLIAFKVFSRHDLESMFSVGLE